MGWGSVGRGIGKSACSSLLRCSAFSTWKKQRGLPWQQIPNQHRAHTPLFHTSLPPLQPPPPVPPRPPSPSSSLATSQQIESCDLRPAYLGEQGSGSDQGSCPKLHSRSQSRSMCQRILVRSRQSSLFSSLFVFILLLPFTLYSNPSEGDLYP